MSHKCNKQCYLPGRPLQAILLLRRLRRSRRRQEGRRVRGGAEADARESHGRLREGRRRPNLENPIFPRTNHLTVSLEIFKFQFNLYKSYFYTTLNTQS